MAGQMGLIAGEGGDPRRPSVQEIGVEGGHRMAPRSKMHDPSVTIEEYMHFASIARQHPNESPGTTLPSNGRLFNKFSLFGLRKTQEPHANVPNIEKSNGGFAEHPAWGNVADDEWVQASRAVRTATWGAVFYLITTDILGPFTTAWAFSQMGYGPGAVLYFIFALFAAYGGYLLWKMFLVLDSDRFPLRCYGDIAYRIYGSVARHTFNMIQSVQLLFNVGLIIISNGQSLSQISNGSIRTLQKLGWLAHAAIWINVFILIEATAVIWHSEPNYDAALANNDAEKGPVATTAGPPESVAFQGQLVGLMQAVYSYGGAMLFVEFMAEMRRPYDFWKGMICAQTFIFCCYLVFGLLNYSRQGQFTINPVYQGVAPYNWQTVGNSLSLVSTLIAALLYGNIGIKVIYSNILIELFKFPSLAVKSGKLIWVVVVPIYWAIAFVIAAAIPSFSNLSGLVAAACILQFSYTFPPLLMIGLQSQKDAIQDGEGFDPATGQTVRHDSGFSRWMRGFRKSLFLNLWYLFFFLGSAVTAVLGIYSAIVGMIHAYAETAVSGFSCTNPIGA